MTLGDVIKLAKGLCTIFKNGVKYWSKIKTIASNTNYKKKRNC